ncbi:hypothetical protein FQN54_003356 [Arachnomyces sp. PD_36]|nr:hypothetical protein FQN54_003356 [Arachnomyces sp. PD_36]
MAPLLERSFVLSLPWGWISSVSAFICFVSYYVYYAYLHPYAKYPGPFLSKFTHLRSGYYAWKGDIHLDIWRCHQKYGPIVRYSYNFLIFDSASTAKEIYSTGVNVTKASEYTSGKLTPNMVTHVDIREHAKRRKLAGPPFSLTNVKRFETRLQGYVQRFMDALQPSNISPISPSSWGSPIDMTDWCSYFTFDVMSDFLFGLKYDLLHDSQHRHIVHDIENTHQRLYVLMHFRALFLGRLDKKLFPQAVRSSRGYLGFIDRLLKDYSCLSEKTQTDIFSAFAEAKDYANNPVFTPDELRSEAILMSSAGQDTTAVALRSIIFYLTRYPNAYEKLCHEIRTTFSADEAIGINEKLKSCSYLNACLTESLRMSPVIGSALYREVGPGGASFNGVRIPEGCYVGAGTYSIHHKEEYFSQPFEFLPERWIVDENSTQEQVNQRLQAWMPYSLGPRGCVGKTLAQNVLLVAVASLVQKYDLRVADTPEGRSGAGHPMGDFGRTNPGEYQLRDFIVAASAGPVIQVRPRV